MAVHPDTLLMLVAFALTGAAFGLLARTLRVPAASWWAATWLAAAAATATLAGAPPRSNLSCWPSSLFILVAVVAYVAGAARVTGRPAPVRTLLLASAGWMVATLMVSLSAVMVGATVIGLVHLGLQGVVAAWCFRAPRHEGGGVLRLLGALALTVGVLYLLLSPFSIDGKILLANPAARPAVFGVSLALAFVQMVAVTGWYHRRAKLKDQQIRVQSIALVERERSTIAQELHDGACQTLMAGKLQLEHALQLGVPATASSNLSEAVSCMTHVINGLRDMSHSLYPSGLTVLGFERAIGELVKGAESRQRRSHLFCDLKGPGLSHPVELALYRILQEVLHNVAQHSHATEVRVSVVVGDGLAQVAVEDNGVGFDLARVPAGMGLASIRERAEVLGGSVEIKTSLGSGVAVIVAIPHPRYGSGPAGEAGMT